MGIVDCVECTAMLAAVVAGNEQCRIINNSPVANEWGGLSVPLIIWANDDLLNTVRLSELPNLRIEAYSTTVYPDSAGIFAEQVKQVLLSHLSVPVSCECYFHTVYCTIVR